MLVKRKTRQTSGWPPCAIGTLGSRRTPISLRKPIPAAMKWRSGCIAPARPGDRRVAVHLHHDAPYTHLAYGKGVLGIREDDIVFSPRKIFFAYGFGNSITFPFSVGATTVLLPGRPDAQAVSDTIERHRPTMLFGLPTLYNALVVHP